MSYFEDCVKKYNSLPQPTRNLFGAPEIIAKLGDLEKEYNIKLDFAVMLVAIDELAMEDVAEYLEKKFSLQPDLADEIAAKLDDKIFTPIGEKAAAVAGQTADLGLLDLNAAAQKQVALEAFSHNLVNIFNDVSDYYQDLNIMLFRVFNLDTNLEDKVIDELYNNQEILTAKPFIADGRNQKGTIANWLKDFINEKGSDLFDSLALSSYFSTSVNAKILDPAEKNNLNKLLKLYRNLVFFPESMNGIPMEKWELFPIERTLGQDSRPVTLSNRPAPQLVTAVPVPPVPSKKPLPSPGAVSKPAPIAAPESVTPAMTSAPLSAKDMEIKKLQDLLRKYPATSLEGRAVASELKQLLKK